uniref:Uncharacterized protein n=1 Tax=Panagrolaimus superbus TaxID=310955 RepID=A0A914YBI4_9BILA
MEAHSELISTDEPNILTSKKPSVLPHPLNPGRQINKALFLGDLYNQNKEVMDAEFEVMQPSEQFLFHGIDIMKRMSSPRYIAAFVLIKKITYCDYDIRVGNLAKESAQKFVTDIFMEAKKSKNVSRKDVEPLMKFLSTITNDTFFFEWLMRPNGSLVAAARKREERQEAAKGFIPRKKAKLMFSDEQLADIDKAAHAAAAAHTQEERIAVIEKSRQVFMLKCFFINTSRNYSPVRCQWILALVQENKTQIPETVVSKFPMFKENASWLQYDFAYTMETVYKKPAFNVSTTLRKFAPAVAAVALGSQIITAIDVPEIENDLMKTASTLVDLFGVYMKKQNLAKLDRLIVQSVTKIRDLC